MTVHQHGTVGHPYTNLGALGVDHVAMGPALDLSDFQANTLQEKIGILSNSPLPGWRNLNVTAQVQADVDAGRETTDYRLRFPMSKNGGVDRAYFNGAEDFWGTGKVPLLFLTYKVP